MQLVSLVCILFSISPCATLKMGIPGSLSESEVTLAAAKPDTDWNSLLEVHMQKASQEDDMTDADMLNGYGDIDLLEQMMEKQGEISQSQVDEVTEVMAGEFGGKMSALKSVEQEESLEGTVNVKRQADDSASVVNAPDIDDYRMQYADCKTRAICRNKVSKTAEGEETAMTYSEFLVSLAAGEPSKDFTSLIATAKVQEGASEPVAISFARKQVGTIHKTREQNVAREQAAAGDAAGAASAAEQAARPERGRARRRDPFLPDTDIQPGRISQSFGGSTAFQRPTWWPQSVPWHPPAGPQKVYIPKGNLAVTQKYGGPWQHKMPDGEDPDEVKLRRWKFGK